MLLLLVVFDFCCFLVWFMVWVGLPVVGFGFLHRCLLVGSLVDGWFLVVTDWLRLFVFAEFVGTWLFGVV